MSALNLWFYMYVNTSTAKERIGLLNTGKMRRKYQRTQMFVTFLATVAIIYCFTKDYWHTSLPWFFQPYHKTCELNKIFENILLVVVFNHPVYSSIPMLKSYYNKAFKTIMFCGSESDLRYDVHKIDILRGHFGYDCLATAVRTKPNFDGYLFVNDDMIVNFWNLREFPRNQIWEGPRYPISVGSYSFSPKWHWWNTRWGVGKCNRTFQELFKLLQTSKQLKNAMKILEKNAEVQPKYLKRSKKNFICIRSRSDIFYMPAKFAEMFTQLTAIFRKYNVFHEIALPTISRMLDFQEHFQSISGIYLPGGLGSPPVEDGRYLWTFYKTTIGFIHPIKFNGTDKKLNTALFNNWIIPYSKNTINAC